MKRVISVVLVAAVLGVGIWGYFYAQARGNAPKFRMARVERGPLTAAISATGNLNAVTTVQVGSQVSGQIRELLVDFNSVVTKGQIIARIDPQMFEAQVNQVTAEVETARAAVLNQTATVEKARADVENARAALAQAKAQTAKADVARADAKRAFDRSAELFRRDLVAQADRDTAQANYESAVAQSESARASEQALMAGIKSAEAQLRVQEAALQSARAQVDQKRASLVQAQTNLNYTTIRARHDHAVHRRAVDVGQTVAASLSAPTLFTIAQDLTKMQVETSVDEADIGRVSLEDRATFTVDAFSGQTFSGVVTQIRKAPLVVQNVVTYTVVISVANPGEKLLPGMTANVKLVYDQKADVVKVPNAALRFRPAGIDIPPAAASGGTTGGGGAPGGAPGALGAGRASPEEIRERLVTNLALTEEQQRKLDPILQDMRQQMAELRSAPEGERQQRAARIREGMRAHIRAILTPEQQLKFDQSAGAGGRSRGGANGRVYVVDNDGKPKAVTLTLGISDGTATEVLRGDLKEGEEVIVGGGASQPPRPGGGTGQPPRLRL
jgi:HlyD family secretion protein